MNGEEEECAVRLTATPMYCVGFATRSAETQGGFWLPKSPGKYFPDFIVELTNGVIVLVEYKMGKMANDPDERHKGAIGELWEAAERRPHAFRLGRGPQLASPGGKTGLKNWQWSLSKPSAGASRQSDCTDYFSAQKISIRGG